MPLDETQLIFFLSFDPSANVFVLEYFNLHLKASKRIVVEVLD